MAGPVRVSTDRTPHDAVPTAGSITFVDAVFCLTVDDVKCYIQGTYRARHLREIAWSERPVSGNGG